MIKKFFCVFLIVFGVALDTYFYSFRFVADGLPGIVAVGSGIALELLLSFAVYNARGSKIFAAIAIIITCYAVVQTAAGQTFALLTHNVSVGVETENNTADFAIEQSKKNMTRLSIEADAITAQLRSLQSTEARAAYAATIYRANNRLAEIERERSQNMNILLKTSSATVNAARDGEAKKSIYSFYSSIPTWSGSDWLKFSFHFFLSALIAIMAPVGIISWNGSSAPQQAFMKQQIELFAATAWFKIRNNTSLYILSEVDFCQLLQRRGIPVETGLYFALVNKCMRMGLINNSGLALEKNYQTVIKKLSGERDKAFLKACQNVKGKVKNMFVTEGDT